MNNDDNNILSTLYKMVQNLSTEVQRLHDKNSELEEEMRALRASIAISRGEYVSLHTKNYIVQKDIKSEASAIEYFENLVTTFGHTLDESDNSIDKTR